MNHYEKNIKSNKLPIIYAKKLDLNEKKSRYSIFRIKTKEGVDTKEYYESFASKFEKDFEKQIKFLSGINALKKVENRFVLTKIGSIFCDEIANQFVL